ncbi:MAG: HEAT repeat domain-containing protein [Desulfomonile tiedjei]|nr:HEAT repeat domain-containing protein [Desulfomonile tiedjei]
MGMVSLTLKKNWKSTYLGGLFPILTLVLLISACEPSKEKIPFISDQDVLTKLALEGSKPEIRVTAARSIKDQKALRKAIMVSADSDVRSAALESLTDQDELLQIGLHHSQAFERRSAVHRIKDQKALTRIMKESSDPQIRALAAGNMGDEYLLADIAINGSDRDIREAARMAIAIRIDAGQLRNPKWLALAAAKWKGRTGHDVDERYYQKLLTGLAGDRNECEWVGGSPRTNLLNAIRLLFSPEIVRKHGDLTIECGCIVTPVPYFGSTGSIPIAYGKQQHVRIRTFDVKGKELYDKTFEDKPHHNVTLYGHPSSRVEGLGATTYGTIDLDDIIKTLVGEESN